jgi:hypothetical protein
MSQYRILKEELPDPHLELYSQTPLVTSFSRFSSLSSDVTKKIWGFVRARRILATMDQDGVLHTRTPLPVTFSICRDARYSTIIYYRIPVHLRGSLPSRISASLIPRPALHLHIFDPDVDTVILHQRNPSDASCYFQYSNSSYREDFMDIKFLEVKRFDWAMLTFLGWKAWSQSYNPNFTYFRCFRGLKKLVLVGGGNGLRTEQEQEDCKAALRRVFEGFNAMDPKYNVPEILIKMP